MSEGYRFYDDSEQANNLRKQVEALKVENEKLNQYNGDLLSEIGVLHDTNVDQIKQLAKYKEDLENILLNGWRETRFIDIKTVSPVMERKMSKKELDTYCQALSQERSEKDEI